MEANKEENFKLSLQTTFYEFAEELVRNHQTKFGAFLFQLKQKSWGKENYSNVTLGSGGGNTQYSVTLYFCLDQV